MKRLSHLLLFLSLVSGLPVDACSRSTPCETDGRSYYIALPDEASGPIASVTYLHGWGGSGKAALSNDAMVSGFLERGFAVIAPDGRPRPNRNGRSWAFHPASENQVQEIAFIAAVRDDATARFGLDRSQSLLAGFSIGGSMAAYSACAAPENFTAYAPLGGNFWRPHPTDCAGPVRLLHTHGWSDGTVPLEGRVVNDFPINSPRALAQGDVFHALTIWRAANGCVHLKADRFETTGPFWRRAWLRCDAGTSLELALFPGGHVVPDGWPDLVVDWFQSERP